MSLLKNNEKIVIGNDSVVINKFIAAGTQGEVYQVSYKNNTYALKWYFKDSATRELYESLEKLTKKGSPSSSFLWPLMVVKKGSNFGYIMNLKKSGFYTVRDLIANKFDLTFENLVKCCISLVDSFHNLHAEGLCYQDISLNNIGINPNTGEVSIWDNDNVCADGANVGNILGTPKFMAPELVTGVKKHPNAKTDSFSLAILLFYMLFRGHPFDGAHENQYKCQDLATQKLLYGSKILYIFDPNNSSNRPVSGIHNSVIALNRHIPLNIKRAFEVTFTKGILDYEQRVRDSAWRKELNCMLSKIYTCPCCGKIEILYDHDVMMNTKKFPACIKCGKTEVLGRMKLGENIIVLANNMNIYTGYLANRCWDNPFETVAKIYVKDRRTYIAATKEQISIERDGKVINVSTSPVQLLTKDKVKIKNVVGDVIL